MGSNPPERMPAGVDAPMQARARGNPGLTRLDSTIWPQKGWAPEWATYARPDQGLVGEGSKA